MNHPPPNYAQILSVTGALAASLGQAECQMCKKEIPFGSKCCGIYAMELKKKAPKKVQPGAHETKEDT